MQARKRTKKPGPKEQLHKIELPFDEALGRLLSAKPKKQKKTGQKKH